MLSFVGPVSYPADAIPPEPPGRLQDFNGDGYYDHAIHGTVQLGNGDNTYRTGQTFHLSGHVGGGQAVGNFNGDGHLDLVFTSTTMDGSESYMDVFQGRGDGTFLRTNVYELGGEPFFRPRAVVDLDRNGTDDLVLVGMYGSLDVWLGNADGSLRQSQHFINFNQLNFVTVRDLNGDGTPDLALSRPNSLSVLLGNGDGTLRSTGTYATGGTYPSSPLVADFDRDGGPDMALLNGGTWDSGTETWIGRSLVVLLGHGNGSFQTPQVLVAGQEAGLRAVADFNADGFPDVAIAVNGLDVSVLLNAADWPPPPPPSISISDASVTEGNAGTRAANFTVTLSAKFSQPVTIAYSTANGTATAGSDYQAVSGILTIPAGQTMGMISVPVNGDRIAEAHETFFANLSSAANATISAGQGVGTILDDEPRISISDVSKSEGKKNQKTQFTFTVTLSAAYDQPVTVSYQTLNDTATTADNDFVAKTGLLTFKPGETTKTITIEVKGDSKKEAHESFFVDLYNNSGNSLFTKKRGLGTILNDD